MQMQKQVKREIPVQYKYYSNVKTNRTTKKKEKCKYKD